MRLPPTIASLPVLAMLAMLAASCQSMHDSGEELVPLNDVPQAAKDAATGAVPGLVLEEAELERGGANAVYCLHGHANGEFYEVEATASGDVLEIEHGDEEEDGDHHDDDDDDGDDEDEDDD